MDSFRKHIPSIVASLFSLVGSTLVANQIGEGYILLTVGSGAWIWTGYKSGLHALTGIETYYLLLNIYALWAWGVV